MFKVSLKDKGAVLKIQDNLIKDINQIISSANVLNEVGEFATERIRYQARTKKPFNNSGNLPPLKESSIRNREYLSKYNQTHSTYSASRSNLTLTGQLLDSLKHFIRGTGLIEIKFDGTHQGYKTASGRGPNVPNEDIAKYLGAKGFVAFDVDALNNNKAFKDRITSIVRGFIRRGLAVRRKLLS